VVLISTVWTEAQPLPGSITSFFVLKDSAEFRSENEKEFFTMVVWVGLAHVKPRPGNDLLGCAVGAFVPSVGLAENEQEFVSVLVRFLEGYGFDVVEIKDIETLEMRKLHFRVDLQVCELASALTSENPIGLGSFHTYNDLASDG
jgi:hypothetical protein